MNFNIKAYHKLHSKVIVIFKGGWSKLYYIQHTLLNNVGQLSFFFFLFFYRNKHTYTHKGEGKRLRVLTLYCNVRTISTIYLLSVRQIFLKKNLIFHLLAVVLFIYLSYMSKFKLSIFTHNDRILDLNY